MNGRIVIVGGGIAGVQAASSLAGSWEVSLVLGEDFLPYYRMPLNRSISILQDGMRKREYVFVIRRLLR